MALLTGRLLSGPLRSFALAGLGLWAAACGSPKHSGEPVVLQVYDRAYSADPAEYDVGTHQEIFASVHAWLISDYRVGANEGILAESWRHTRDFKEWTFRFRPGMTFENGDPIRPRDLAESWLRLTRVLKARGSEPEALKHLVGYADFPRKSAGIRGIAYDESGLTLSFSRPYPTLLDEISSGFYAVVHPSCYDRRTGKWLDAKKTVASGPYGIKDWSAEQLLMTLRPEYPAALRHPRALARVIVRWSDNPENDVHLVDSSSRRKELADRGFEFHGGAASGIVFFRVHSWKDPSSPFSRRAFRREVRLAFYEELEKRSDPPRKSFFPTTFKGVHEMSAALGPEDAAFAVPADASIRYSVGESTDTTTPQRHALEAAARRLGMRFALVSVPGEELFAGDEGATLPRKNDIAGLVTDIGLDDPGATIRFMVGSKEGIKLPDPTGRLAEAIKHDPIDIQKVNEILWDDALIWPVYPLATGIWARPELDFSLVNLIRPPTPLYLIGWKK